MHQTLDEQIAALQQTLRGVQAKDMTDEQFELAFCLESHFPDAQALDEQIATLHAALLAMKPKDLTDEQFALLCTLDNEFGV